MSVLSYHVYRRINPHVHASDDAVGQLANDWIVQHIDHEGMAGMNHDAFERAVSDLHADILSDHRAARELFTAMRF